MQEVIDTQETQVAPRDQMDLLSQPDSDSISTFHFKLPVFEGPLDLLLHLIREHKIDIYDIPIVDITQQYMQYLEIMKELNLEIAGEFLVMAATLIHIKSRMLLPVDEEAQEEPQGDPRAELVQRLLEYQAYKDSSSHLRKREDIWKDIFKRSISDEGNFEFEPEPLLFEANLFDLFTSFKNLLEKAPEQAIEITRESLTVKDRINFIMGRIEHEDGIRFEDIFEEGFTRLTLVVTFLALLEAIRIGLVKLYQEKTFGSIWLINPQKQDFMNSADAIEEVLSSG